jgi:hypothetical protein
MSLMKIGPGLVAVGGLWSALVAGCGSSGSSGPSIAQACADVAGQRCNERSECTLPDGTTGTGFSLPENYGDLSTCLTRETLNCTNGLMSPGTGNSPAKVELCAAEFVSYTCQNYFDNQPPTDCAVTGSEANGAGCAFNGQCGSGYCQGTKSSACGTCADAPAVGADCTNSSCTTGQRCLTATRQCAAVVSENGACDATHPCDKGLVCFGNDTATNTTGTCETAGTRVGQACGGTMPACDGTLGLYCGGPAGAKTCMRVIYGAAGGPDGGADASAASPDGGTGAGIPCGVLADGTHVGCVAGGCYTATGVASGTDLGACKPFAPDNGPCDYVLGPDCMLPARCAGTGVGTAGTCMVPQGSKCTAP